MLQIPALSPDFTHTRPILAALLVVYAITMLVAIGGGFWVRSFRQIPEPEPFVEKYLSRPAAETKGVVIETQVHTSYSYRCIGHPRSAIFASSVTAVGSRNTILVSLRYCSSNSPR